VSEVLQTLGFRDFVVQLNHRVLLTAMLEAAGIEASRHGDALIAIDKLDKIGRDGVVQDMAGRGIAADAAARALDAAMSDALPTGTPAADNIAAIMQLADATAAKGHVKFTPRLARGLSYYTGAIMEIAVPDLAGSLGGGGRYDGLIGMFSGEQIPACGFSLGLERILVVMGERGMFPESVRTSGPDVLVTIFDTPLAADSLQLAAELRSAHLRVEVYPEALRNGKDLGKAFKYADARKARFVTVMGQDELTRGEVKMKDLQTGEQQAVARGTVAATLIHRLADLGNRTSDIGSRIPDAQ
jgi:histidyl-tRNA synthetase